jgi:hypothetical protein
MSGFRVDVDDMGRRMFGPKLAQIGEQGGINPRQFRASIVLD